jgi:uncharacterized protein (DUF433 family)
MSAYVSNLSVPLLLAYIKRIPPTIPPDCVLVHNHVRPTRRLGQRGFRAWLALPSAALEICSCGWAPGLPEHYRVRRADWSQCPDAERIPGKLSGAWCVKGHRVRCEDIIGQFDAGCSAEQIAGPDIYPDIPLDVVRRILTLCRPPRRCFIIQEICNKENRRCQLRDLRFLPLVH